MDTITSSRRNTGGVSVRRTESHDVLDIISFFSTGTEGVFGRVDVMFLLEKSNLALTLCNEKSEVIAHAAFLDYPNWNITDQANWEPFLHKNYTNHKCTPLNTLFMHLFVAKEGHAAGCSRETVRRAFILLPELQFILLFIPAEENLEPGLRGVFAVMPPAVGSAVGKKFTLLVCPRHRCHPRLHVRQARLEDYDDLMLIWTPQSKTLKKTFGEHLLVDLMEHQDEENKAAVCEVDGTAVGFMSLCSQVNVSLFQECFDLGPFHGLCKQHAEDVLQVPRKPSVQEGEDESNQTSQKAAPVSRGDLERVPGPDAAVQEDEATTVSQTELPLDDGSTRDLKASETRPFETEEEGAFRPVYRGASNAFCIRLLCIDEAYETRSLDFLHYAFEVFPDRDFCVILVPHHVLEFPLLQSFARAVPFCTSSLGRELYVLHRAGLLTSFNVRRATTNDLLGIKTLAETLSLNERIWNDCKIFTQARRDPDGMPVQAFVAEVLDQIVGVSVIRDEMDIEYVRSRYNIEDFIHFNCHQQEEHGHLCHFVLNPVFHRYTKHFLKEILRLAHKSALYYPVYPQYVEGKLQSPCAHSLTSALHYMTPVRPRRQIVYPLQELGMNAPSEQLSKDQLSFSLNLTNRKLVLESKVSINTRIVVVGASDVGISFLETLIFWPRLKFNNLTLISVHGLPGKDPPGSKRRRFLINSHCFNDEDYAQMSLCSWVNVVVGKMTGINRAAKYVVVSEEKKVPYDYLVLCTGQNYQALAPTGADIKLPTDSQVMSEWPQRYTGKIPSNHFTLNDDQDCLRAAHWLQENLVSSRGNVIVYGNTIDIYTTVETLLSLGIDGSRIHLVQPPLSSDVPCLHNAEVEGAVREALAQAGVALHGDGVLAQWGEGSDPELITWAAFTTATTPLKLQCSAFFSFAYRAVDYETFKAVNDACLVFDGKLVIDAKFCTNDVSIRAAGPLTKFSRRYCKDEWTHSNFSSREIGFELAASMLSLFDPTLQPRSEPPEGPDRLIPMYKGCKVKGGVLPGGYNYLHVSKPAVPTRLDTELAQCDHGTEIITGEAGQGNYFRMHFSRYKMVDGITCFSKEPFPVSNYLCLYGQHERLLNDLFYRWRAGQITDLYSYFREPWSMAIYHDRFIDLQKELRQILMSEQVRKTTAECILLFRQFVSVVHFGFFSHLSPEALCFCLALSSGKPEQTVYLTEGGHQVQHMVQFCCLGIFSNLPVELEVALFSFTAFLHYTCNLVQLHSRMWRLACLAVPLGLVVFPNRNSLQPILHPLQLSPWVGFSL
ncbi:PREDICTED: cilia- and flagella-associated protein 61 isoform X1 [Lepidothrix coronata]|uniref:Cilia- and flagella-associated protein 61 isoform X1 n=1 Tax=Lepidothrix coronata TaxID=321398 RepID=A0A6J0J1V8_9PASS|nr:PREDICTED: cilia- and flagella-associated protein 61 isoform X1 [Lepidothrix coronata]XP_017692896.1 PREDICTED: cilia- and flagella-associated protein 61 isoform X1 [Lepidothrix coronata]XP_017692897.1 PREDICTED: cilia- and flagella-associated protein 61 isoform X1 [Lepidothrix coronata]